MPPLLVVLFLTRHRQGDVRPDGDGRHGNGVSPRVAVVRDDLIGPLVLPGGREGAARLIGALALPAWMHNPEFAPAREHLGLRRTADDVLHSMRVSSPTESRARTRDLGPALEAAGLVPSDYLDIDLQGNRDAFRELRNVVDDVSLLLDAEDLDDVRWILSTANAGGPGEPDVAMNWLWDPAAKQDVLARFDALEAHVRRSPGTARRGWQLADPMADAEDVEHPASRPPRRVRGYVLAAAIAMALFAVLAIGVRSWTDDPASRPPGVVLRVDNRITSGAQVQEDPIRLPLTTRPVTGCGKRGCVVEAGPTWESKQRIDRAVCQQQGERITNGHDASKADDSNPLLDDTTRYYGVVLEDGTRGYVAELWIARPQRGGLGLPPCSTTLPDLARR